MSPLHSDYGWMLLPPDYREAQSCGTQIWSIFSLFLFLSHLIASFMSGVPDACFIIIIKRKYYRLSFQMLCCNIIQKHTPTPPPVLAKHSDLTNVRMSLRNVSHPSVHAHETAPLLSNPQPVGRAFALVQPASDRTSLTPEPVKSTEEQVEVIKVGVAHLLLYFWSA